MAQGPPKCDFCGAAIDDMMVAFLDHVDANPGCHAAWQAWRDNVRRETGGT